MTSGQSLAEEVLQGDRLALSRMLTQIENDTLDGRDSLKKIFLHTGNAHIVGVTGAPGTGKSSLVNQMARYYRNPLDGESPRRIGIVAVDPSSPFTGGAILGDRIRMRDLSGDPDVFIRSMASRGSLGGLATTTVGLVDVLDAAGFDLIMIETVGAGQGEVDIARLAHTTLVIEAPGFGDEIQAIKAGILEIADILVVNKADLPGVENTERILRNMLELSNTSSQMYMHHGKPNQILHINKDDSSDPISWQTPVLRTIATEANGINELCREIDRHRDYLRASGDWERRVRSRLESTLDHLIQAALVARWRQTISEQAYRQALSRLVSREISPLQAAEELIEKGWV